MFSHVPLSRYILILYIDVYVGIGLLINFLIFSLGWQDNLTSPYPILVEIPPAVHAIGWTVVLMSLAVASWWLQSHTGDKVKVSQQWIFGYFITTILWPLLTLSTGVMYAGIMSFLISLAAGIYALWLSYSVSRMYLLLVGVPLIWMMFQFFNAMSGWRMEIVQELMVPFVG